MKPKPGKANEMTIKNGMHKKWILNLKKQNDLHLIKHIKQIKVTEKVYARMHVVNITTEWLDQLSLRLVVSDRIS